RLGVVVHRVDAEDQCGHGGRVHDPPHVLDRRELQPGEGAGGAEALGDVDRLDGRLRGEVVDDLRARPAGAGGHERLDHRYQLVAGEVGDGVRARLEDEGGAVVVQVDAGEHLPAVEAG